jgi:hypothetical protein
MRFLIKNKTSKNIVLLIDGCTTYLYPKGSLSGKDHLAVDSITPQIKNIKMLKFIQISKIERFRED